MKVWYDTEFLERGNQHPIIPISIGMVREDGAELYLVNRDAPIQEILDNEWLRLNVWPHIRGFFEGPTEERAALRWGSNPGLRPASDWQLPIQGFCAKDLKKDEQVELWAYFADYDHVVLSQVFGAMVNLPDHMPMFTLDLKHEMQRRGVPRGALPMNSSSHNALEDARWVRAAYERVMGHA